MISPLASVHPNAKIDETAQIGPFVFIDDDVEIGAGTIVDANATICSHTRIGKNCHIFPSAVIGAVPQDLKFHDELTYTIIGDNNVLRECVTIHRGTFSKEKTVIGNNNLIMAYCHVAHDCVLGNNIIMSNTTQLAGEVVVDDFAFIGGGTLAHQFSHIGSYVMIQGGTKVLKDVPPFVTAGRDPIMYCGLNSVGLHRRGFSNERIEAIHAIYRILFQSDLNVSQALALINETIPASEDRDYIVNFVKSSPRGVIKGI